MNKSFGDRFKELRNELNLTQDELISSFNKEYFYNFTKSAISMYENNKRMPEIDALISFSNFFNVSLDYLLGKSDVRNPYDENKVSNEKVSTIAAHLDADELSDDDLDDINKFIEFVKAKKNK